MPTQTQTQTQTRTNDPGIATNNKRYYNNTNNMNQNYLSTFSLMKILKSELNLPQIASNSKPFPAWIQCYARAYCIDAHRLFDCSAFRVVLFFQKDDLLPINFAV